MEKKALKEARASVQDTTQNTRAARFSLRFYIGIVLLTTNQPLGWAALLACNAVAIGKQDLFFTCLGFVLYALSWVMLGVGALLAGPEGIRYSRLLIRRGWRYCVQCFKKNKK